MNYHGKVSCDPPKELCPPPVFRSTFPVKYYLIDFGCSIQFPHASDPGKRLVEPFRIGREQRAPETSRLEKYDPFPADVYALARLFYAYLRVWLFPPIHSYIH
jgi:hypothetical protein